MAPIVIAFIGSAIASTGPVRGPIVRSGPIQLTSGRNPSRLVVKLAENQGLRFDGDRLEGPKPTPVLNRLLSGSQPLFSRDPSAIRQSKRAGLADLTLYRVITGPDVIAKGNELLKLPSVETAYLAPTPVPPPVDIPPTTDDFSFDQFYDQAGPEGFGFDIADQWPGGDAANVSVANIEYGFDPTHEDLTGVDFITVGPHHDDYQFHGNGVFGILAAPDNGYGVTGLAKAAQFLMVSPFIEDDLYNVANAIDIAASQLVPGDVLLIEQQGWAEDTYTPVEVDPAVFDAIALAVDSGIVVIEPAGNGNCDLDDPIWGGAFDRTVRDSGAIMVGGGASPLSPFGARSYHPFGSCYGDRIDVQGWYDRITTLSAADGEPSFTDLFYPNRDGRQAYTAEFGGTSGAAPMVTATAAVLNSVAIETRGVPWHPLELRAVLSSTGHPQTGDTTERIGSQPDLRRMLRLYGVR